MRPYLEGVGFLFIAFIVILYLCRKWLDTQAYREVNSQPRIPMAECPKHGLIPEDSMLVTTATAVGRPDLQVKHCPFCYDDRLAKVTETLEGVK